MVLDNRFRCYTCREDSRLLDFRAQSLEFLSNDNPWNATEIVPDVFQVPGSVE